VTEDVALAQRMEEVSVDLLPGVKPWEVEWKYCFKQGEVCECPIGTVRYGHAGKAKHYVNGGKFFHSHPEDVRWGGAS
jgi:hypothetical protein